MSASHDNPPNAVLIYKWENEPTAAGRNPHGPWVVAHYEVNVLPGQFASPEQALTTPITGLPVYGQLWKPSGDFAVPCRDISVIEPLGPTKFIARAVFGFLTLGGGGPARNYRTTFGKRVDHIMRPRWQKDGVGTNAWYRTEEPVERYWAPRTYYGQINQGQAAQFADEAIMWTGSIRQIGPYWYVFRGAEVYTDVQNATRYVAMFETHSPIKGLAGTATLRPVPNLTPLETWVETQPDGANLPVITARIPEDQYVSVIPPTALTWISDL